MDAHGPATGPGRGLGCGPVLRGGRGRVGRRSRGRGAARSALARASSRFAPNRGAEGGRVGGGPPGEHVATPTAVAVLGLVVVAGGMDRLLRRPLGRGHRDPAVGSRDPRITGVAARGPRSPPGRVRLGADAPRAANPPKPGPAAGRRRWRTNIASSPNGHRSPILGGRR